VTFSPLPPVGCELTDPLARLLFQLHQAGLFGPKPGVLSNPVPQSWRCEWCASAETRLKGIALIVTKRGPITGVVGRCRRCGGMARYLITATERQVAA